MTTPEILNKLQQDANATEKELAAALKITTWRLKDYMSGTHKLELQRFLSACQVLKVHPRDVLTHFELMSLTTCEGVANPNKNK